MNDLDAFSLDAASNSFYYISGLLADRMYLTVLFASPFSNSMKRNTKPQPKRSKFWIIFISLCILIDRFLSYPSQYYKAELYKLFGEF